MVTLTQIGSIPSLPDLPGSKLRSLCAGDATSNQHPDTTSVVFPTNSDSRSQRPRVHAYLRIAYAIKILAMARYLHTMVRITDPGRSRVFYEALGMEFRKELPIVRNGELEATNYFFGFPGQEEELELTFNHDGRSYELGTGYGHIAVGVEDLDATLVRLGEQGIEPEREPYRVRAGGSRLAFVRDPDQYRVELIERK